MKISQISICRFHHFHLARQLERLGFLQAIFTGYPRFKLRDETGIPRAKIRTFPWLQAPHMVAMRYGLTTPSLSREWDWWARETLDRHVSRHLEGSDGLIALSG